MSHIISMWNDFYAGIPNVIVAVLILLLAFLVSWIVKKLVIKLMKVIKIEEDFSKAGMSEENIQKTNNFIAKLAYLITFVLFIPGIFGKLGLSGVSEPIVSMMNIFMTYLPNIVAATVILIIGLFVAKMVKQLLIPVFKKINMDKWLEKLGVEKKEEMPIAEVLANVVYVLILIPIIIAVLNTLNIAAISDPAIDMLNQIFNFIPKIAVAIVVLFVGNFIAKLVFTILENVLVSIGTDKFVKNVFDTTGTEAEIKFSLAKTISYIVKYVILIFFLVQALNILKLDILTNIGNAIIAYMPYALSAIIILGIAILLGNFIEKSILKRFPSNKLTALIAKTAIIVIGVFITLYQLGIATQMINIAFVIILAALAVAFAIAFGFGGRDFASHMLQKLEDKIDNK